MSKLVKKTHNKNGKLNLLLSLLFTTFVFGAFLFIQKIFPFGQALLLKNDADSQYLPFLIMFKNLIKNNLSLFYSWNIGGGVNMFALICYYLMSPFSLVALFFNETNMVYGYELIIFLKTLMTGVLSTYYFKEHFKRYDLSVNAFSLLYTFCGFYTAYYANIMWLDALYMLPLVALGIEKIVSGKKSWLYIFSLAYTVLTNFYMGYMICIFSALYFIFLLFSKEFTGKNKKNNTKKEIGEASIKTVLIRFFGGSLLAIMISAITLIPVYSALSYGAYKQLFKQGQSFLFNFFDFVMYMLGTEKLPGLSYADAAVPVVYSGILSFMLLPIFFFSKKIKWNEKLSTGILISFLYASLVIPKLNEIWHGVSVPSGLPYRFVYIFSFVVILTAFKAYDKAENIRLWSILLPFLCFGTVFGFVYKNGLKDKFGNPYIIKLIAAAAVLCIIYAVFLILIKTGKLNRTAAGITAILLIMFELIATQSSVIYPSSKTKLKTVEENYNNSKQLLSESDKSFYRTELSFRNGLAANAAGMDNTNSISQFSSMAANRFAGFQGFLGLAGNINNFYAYRLQTPIYNKLYNIKYIADNIGIAEKSKYLEKTDKKADDKEIYMNPEANSLGFVSSDFIELYSPNHGVNGNQSILWNYLTGTKPIALKDEKISGAKFSGCEYVPPKKLSEEYLKLLQNNENSWKSDFLKAMDITGGFYPYKMTAQNVELTLTFTAKKSAEHYMLFNTSDLKKVDITYSDGKTVNIPAAKAEMQSLIDIGFLNEGETVKIKFYDTDIDFEKLNKLDKYKAAKITDSVFCTISSLDDAVYRQGLENLKRNGELKITEHSDTHLKGSVDAAFDSDLWTSIPLDNGWRVFVDGEETKIQENNTFGTVIFPIKKGHHEIEMRYTPPGLKEGSFVSVAGAVLCILIFALEKVKIKKDELPDEEELSTKTDDKNTKKGENDD